jgi:hypothetical protein
MMFTIYAGRLCAWEAFSYTKGTSSGVVLAEINADGWVFLANRIAVRGQSGSAGVLRLAVRVGWRVAVCGGSAEVL